MKLNKYVNVQEKRLKESFDDIPTLDELHALEAEGLKGDIILVDTAKDKKLSMLKQLISALVRGLNSNPHAMIKKIAGLVSMLFDFLFIIFLSYHVSTKSPFNLNYSVLCNVFNCQQLLPLCGIIDNL